jgi:hypothetical protein
MQFQLELDEVADVRTFLEPCRADPCTPVELEVSTALEQWGAATGLLLWGMHYARHSLQAPLATVQLLATPHELVALAGAMLFSMLSADS